MRDRRRCNDAIGWIAVKILEFTGGESQFPQSPVLSSAARCSLAEATDLNRPSAISLATSQKEKVLTAS